MLIYFDESYDNGHNILVWGALFNPHPKFLNRRITEIKKKYNYVDRNGILKEIKYNLCTNEINYKISKEIIDAFFESTSWFRSIVIETKDFDINYFGKPYESEKIKKARAYKKFTELLLAHNTENIQGAVLLVDYMSRCKEDEFIERMKDLFCQEKTGYSLNKSIPTFVRIQEIDSKLPQYQVNSVCDILMGCIINNHFPTQNKFKNDIREYLISKLNVKNLLRESWSVYSKGYVEKYWPKFNIWYLELKKEEEYEK